jgi:hypothetical protein
VRTLSLPDNVGHHKLTKIFFSLQFHFLSLELSNSLSNTFALSLSKTGCLFSLSRCSLVSLDLPTVLYIAGNGSLYDSTVLLSTKEEEVDKDELQLDRVLQGTDNLDDLLSCGPLVGGKCKDCKFADIKDQTDDLISCIANALNNDCFICKKKGTRNLKMGKKNTKDKFSCVTPKDAKDMECLDPTEGFNNV